MLPNGKQRLFFSCFTVSCTSCRTGFACFSTLSVRLLKLYSCFPTLSIGFIKSLQITVFARKNTQPCHTVRRVSDLKSAQHKKSSSAATWIFCMEPIRFGIIKGEQPLIIPKRVLFWFSFGTQKRTYPVEKNCIKVKKSVPLEYALYGKHCSKKRTPKNP